MSEKLTPTEEKLIGLLTEGAWPADALAKAMDCTPSTLRKHLSLLRTKLPAGRGIVAERFTVYTLTGAK